MFSQFRNKLIINWLSPGLNIMVKNSTFAFSLLLPTNTEVIFPEGRPHTIQRFFFKSQILQFSIGVPQFKLKHLYTNNSS